MAISHALGMDKYAFMGGKKSKKVRELPKVKQTPILNAPPPPPPVVVTAPIYGVPGSKPPALNKTPTAQTTAAMKSVATATLPKTKFTNTVASVKTPTVPRAPTVNPVTSPVLRPPRMQA